MKQHFFSLAILSTILSSCMSQTSAPIDYGSSSSASGGKYSSSSSGDDIVEKPIIREKTNWGDKEVENTISNPNIDVAEQGSVAPNPITQAPPSEEVPLRTTTISHEVIEGETIDGLAAQYGVSKASIIKANKLKAPYTLDELQIIKIPPQVPVNRPTTDAMADEAPVGDAIQPNDLANAAPAPTSSETATAMLPVTGKIISKFGDNQSGSKNNGINIESALGSNVQSLSTGKAVYSGTDPKFGNLIIIKSNDAEIFMAYSHMSDLVIKQGESVSKGQIIGHVGQTGEVASPQLHFAVRQGRTPIDPEKYLAGQ